MQDTEKLKAWIKRSKLSRFEISDLSGVSKSWIDKFMAGGQNNPLKSTIDSLVTLAKTRRWK